MRVTNEGLAPKKLHFFLGGWKICLKGGAIPIDLYPGEKPVPRRKAPKALGGLKSKFALKMKFNFMTHYFTHAHLAQRGIRGARDTHSHARRAHKYRLPGWEAVKWAPWDILRSASIVNNPAKKRAPILRTPLSPRPLFFCPLFIWLIYFVLTAAVLCTLSLLLSPTIAFVSPCVCVLATLVCVMQDLLTKGAGGTYPLESGIRNLILNQNQRGVVSI